MAWAEWFDLGTPYQKQSLNLIYARALHESYDIDNLVVDLGLDVHEAILHDDGMLPAGLPVTTRESHHGMGRVVRISNTVPKADVEPYLCDSIT